MSICNDIDQNTKSPSFWKIMKNCSPQYLWITGWGNILSYGSFLWPMLDGAHWIPPVKWYISDTNQIGLNISVKCDKK